MLGLSLCSGIGGLELGLRDAIGSAYRVACHVEGEAFAAAVLVSRMQEGAMVEAPIWDDLRTFDGRAWRGRVYLISAGIPCQPHSLAGKRRGAEDERNLWPDAARIIGEVRPGLVFLENVPGAMRFYFEHVLPDLSGLGYRTESGLFSAAEVGAPHRRERLFVLAYARGVELRQAADRSESTGINRQRCKSMGNPVSPVLRNGPGRSGGTSRQGAPEHRGAGEALGDAASARCQGSIGQGRSGARRFSVGESFPPGPDTSPEDWPADVPQPCVRRGSDGTASRLDRLRALGNGVVPATAARAFRVLAERAGVMRARTAGKGAQEPVGALEESCEN